MAKTSPVWGLNENGEIVAVTGTGTGSVTGFLSEAGIPVDGQGRLVIKGDWPILVLDTNGVVTGLADPKTGNAIAIGGGSTQQGLKHSITSSITFELAVDQTSLYPPRLAVAERNRKRLVFKNPATNTVSFQFGSRQADNIQNPNYNFTPSYTIAPGQELVCFFDEAQWWGRQANTAFVTGQMLTIEKEVLV